MKSRRIDRRRKRQERRRRYKKNHEGLFLIIKIACICYLVIFGTSYMSSGTSAFFSSQNTVPSTITAGVWEVPASNSCGEEDEIDTVASEGSTEQNVNKDEESEVVPGDETVVDCKEKDEESMEGEEDTAPIEVGCRGEDDEFMEEQDITSSEETKAECESIDDDITKDDKNDDAVEDEKATEVSKEVADENEKEENKSKKNTDSDGSKDKGPPEGGSQLQPDNKDAMPVTEYTEMKSGFDSIETKDPEDS